MHFIKKIPYIFSALMTIIVGIISANNSIEQQQTYIRMIVSLIAFFVLGIFIKNTIERIQLEIQENQETDKVELGELGAVDKGLSQEDYGNNDNIGLDANSSDGNMYSEDFSPLKVSQIIKTKTED
jgi:hypothetical protein